MYHKPHIWYIRGTYFGCYVSYIIYHHTNVLVYVVMVGGVGRCRWHGGRIWRHVGHKLLDSLLWIMWCVPECTISHGINIRWVDICTWHGGIIWRHVRHKLVHVSLILIMWCVPECTICHIYGTFVVPISVAMSHIFVSVMSHNVSYVTYTVRLWYLLMAHISSYRCTSICGNGGGSRQM